MSLLEDYAICPTFIEFARSLADIIDFISYMR